MRAHQGAEAIQLCEAPQAAEARPLVCVQGLGFVGAAMSVAIANARHADGSPRFEVIGVELENSQGLASVSALNVGRFPFASTDRALARACSAAHETGHLSATTDPAVYGRADVILVDINLDLETSGSASSDAFEATVDYTSLRQAIATIGCHMQPGALVIVETTVPPGTCAKVVAPQLALALSERGLPADAFLLAHSYERVMPGPDYLRSITDYWRVFSGYTPEAGDACAAFLEQVVNVDAYPLRRLASTTASETAKVLENSFRAVNIALIDEWSRFAEAAGVDLFEVLEAIRLRPSHANIRDPGFGVGGYCLPKDPLLALSAARQLHNRADLDFPFCRQAVRVNGDMPTHTLATIEQMLGGDLSGKTLLLLGVSYRTGVADTRWSPSAVFAHAALELGARIVAHDPLVRDWPELGLPVAHELPAAKDLDGLVIAVAHDDYHDLDLAGWACGRSLAVVDAANLMNKVQRTALRSAGCRLVSIGRGEGL